MTPDDTSFDAPLERHAPASQPRPDLVLALMRAYPVLQAGPEGWELDAATLTAVDVPAGTPLFAEHAPCAGFPLLLSGLVQVSRGAPDGRSLELYRVGPGEVCIVSAACAFGAATTQSLLPARGHATTATRLVVLPPAVFQRWCAHEGFRRFVFGVFASRLGDLIELAEAVAFQPLEQRLAAALLGRGEVLRVTHARLAAELGTAREIVTRLLRRFEDAGWVKLGRERIDLLDTPGLRRCAAGGRTAGHRG